MNDYNNIKPSKEEQAIAIESYNALDAVLKQIHSKNPEIEIEETKERIKIPINALRFLNEMLEAMSKGKIVSLVPVATEVTTQKAAEILNCSRPYLIKLLENGEINYTKVGKHRRIRFEDVMSYKKKMKAIQKQYIIDIMQSDEDAKLYDT